MVHTMKRKPLPPTEFLKECLSYDPDTGRLSWRQRPLHHFVSHKGWITWNARFAGKEAGNKNLRPNGDKRYIEVGFASGQEKGRRTFAAVFIIFAMMGVEVHEGHQIDHKDHDEWNNRWNNLRTGTPQQNIFNRICKKKFGLPKGVYKNGNGFKAVIGIGYSRIYLGTFKSPDDAYVAYCEAAKKHHGDFACLEHTPI